MRFPESELVLNPDGSTYHLHLKPGELADKVITVGDPQRVAAISQHFDSVEQRTTNREIVTHTGYYGGVRITVLSTGMGAGGVEIIMNELDALVNIDLKRREPKERHTSLQILRLGTSGALLPELPLNSIVASELALGMDGMLYFYDGEGVLETEVAQAFTTQTDWRPPLPYPYFVKAGKTLLERFATDDIYRGITYTAPGFYAPQGRVLRYKLGVDIHEKIARFSYQNKGIANFEMETAVIYGLGKLLGHQALSLNCIIANRALKNFNANYHQAMDDMVKWALERWTEGGAWR